MKKTKINKGIFIGVVIIIAMALISLGMISVFDWLRSKSAKLAAYTQYPATIYKIAEINVKRPESQNINKFYAYNERVPEEVILEELYSLADRFNLIGQNWEKIVRCEATGKDGKLDNLICNQTSTACGISQYLIRTWYNTESWKQYRRARTDYKASLWEMGLDLANGEQDKWQECLDKTGIYNFKK